MRIGQVDPEGGVPRVIRRQQWSVFNVPLWASAAGDRSCAVLEWLAQSVRNVSIPVCGVEMAVNMMVYSPLRGCRSGSTGRGSHNHGGVPTSAGEHQNGSCIVQPTSTPGSLLWSQLTYRRSFRHVSTESEKCRKRVTHVEFLDLQPWPMHGGRQWMMSIWQKFSTGVSLCCRVVHSRCERQATRVALETLHYGVLGHDTLMETRGWKLFILFLFMLLRRPRGHAKVGKDELCRRFDKFAAGQWVDLLLEGHQSSAQGVEATHIGADSIERRVAAACHKIKLGEIS